MRKILLFAGISLLFSYLSCVPEEDNPFKYPKVSTNAVSDITTEGARFNATVDFPQLDKISEFGFIWGRDSNLSQNTFTLLMDSQNGNVFYADIQSSLIAQQTYYVKAYVKEGGKIIYGKIQSFISLGSAGPKITSINPQTAAIGDTIEVTGKNFTSDISLLYTNPYMYGYQNITYTLLKKEKTKLTFVLPDTTNITMFNEITMAVSVEGNLSKSPIPLKLDIERMTPKIISVNSKTVKACDTITITGKNFKIGKRNINVTVTSNFNDLTIIKTTADQIVGVLKRVPRTESEFPLSVYNGYYYGSTTINDITIQQPEILSVSPSTYKPKDIITIKVKNFPVCDNSLYAFIVYYGNLQILSKSKDEIKVQLPESCLGTVSIGFGFSADYYSNAQIFQTPELTPQPPTITSIIPNHGSLGDEIVIKGVGLKKSYVNFLDTISTSDTEIRGKLKELAMLKEDGYIDVELFSCGSTTTENGFKYDPVEITDFNPKIITSSMQEITITGKNFSSFPSQNKITVGSYVIYQSSTDNHTLTIPASTFITDASTSITLSLPVSVENNMNRSATGSSSLIINHEASWTRLSDFPYPNGIPFSLSFVIGNKGYVTSQLYPRFFEYDPASDSWEQKDSYPGHYTGYKVTASAGGKGYMGLDPTPAYNSEWWEFNPASDSWTPKANYPGTYVNGGFAFELGGKVYVGGGNGNLEFWEYNPSSDSWTKKQDLPIRGGTGNISFAFQGKGYLYGKSTSSTYSEYIYNPTSDSWSSRSILPFEESSPYVSMVFNDYVLIGGGPQSPNFNKNLFYKVIPGSGNVLPVESAGGGIGNPAGFAIGNFGYFGLGSTFFSGSSTVVWKIDPLKVR